MKMCGMAQDDMMPDRERNSPKNAEHAVCFQIHDTLELMYGAGKTGHSAIFDSHLTMLVTQINGWLQSHRPEWCEPKETG